MDGGALVLSSGCLVLRVQLTYNLKGEKVVKDETDNRGKNIIGT